MEHKELEHRFSELSKEKQNYFMADIAKKVAERTALGKVFAHINRSVDVGVISCEELDELAKHDLCARFEADVEFNVGSDNYVATYSPFVDKIVYRGNLPLSQLLMEGMTSEGILAHERLHTLQHRASGLLPIYRQLILAGYTENGCLYLGDEIQPIVKQIQGAPRGTEIEHFGDILREQNCAFELAARCMTPVFEGGRPSFSLEELSKGSL